MQLSGVFLYLLLREEETFFFSVQDRIHSFAEVNGVLSADDTVIESKRCLKYTLELAEKSAERMAKMDKDTFLLECPD
jgi:hypothetical protein